MKKINFNLSLLIMFSASLILFVSFSQAVLAAEGDLIWAQNSKPPFDLLSGGDITVDSSEIYAASAELAGTGSQWRMEKRDLTTGNLDTSFGSGGIITRNFSSAYDVASGIAIDPTGIYVVGYDNVPGTPQWRMEKWSKNGTLLWSQTSNPGGGWETASGVTVDSTGVYIVGTDSLPGNNEWRMEKRNLTNGSLIWAQTSNPTGDADDAADVVADSTGIYIVGTDGNLPSVGNRQWRIEKRDLNSGGLLWAQTRRFSPNPPASNANDFAAGIAVDSSGVYITGASNCVLAYCTDWRVEKRSLTTGGVIWSQVVNFGGGAGNGLDVVANPNGIYVIGNELPTFWSSSGLSWRIEKRDLNNGNLDTTFGSSGVVYSTPPEPTATRRAAINSSGLYITGTDTYPLTCSGWICTPATTQWRIEKRETGCSGPFPIIWTDDPVISGTTTLSGVHFNEMRSGIDVLRADTGLPAVVWSPATFTAGVTTLTAAQFNQMRTAISEVYTTCLQPAPVWTDTTITTGMSLDKARMDELRNTISNAP